MTKILETHIAREVVEGAGTIINRVFGHGQTSKFDPFLMLDYFETNETKTSKGFPWHPHKGIETITYMLRGRIEHEDTLGNKGSIGPGELQWMTAGKGIMHQEMPLPSPNGFQGFQFWVNLKSTEKLVEPSYKLIQEGEMKQFNGDGFNVSVISGTYENVIGPIDKSNLGIKMFHVKVNSGSSINLQRDFDKQGYVFLFKGDGLLSGDLISGKTAYTLSPGTISITANSDIEFIFAEGTPLKEPISWYGPIVMNTNEEIQETLKDLQNGTFIKEDVT